MIVNLQSTVKDKHASLLVRGNVDDVMYRVVTKELGLTLPIYTRKEEVQVKVCWRKKKAKGGTTAPAATAATAATAAAPPPPPPPAAAAGARSPVSTPVYPPCGWLGGWEWQLRISGSGGLPVGGFVERAEVDCSFENVCEYKCTGADTSDSHGIGGVDSGAGLGSGPVSSPRTISSTTTFSLVSEPFEKKSATSAESCYGSVKAAAKVTLHFKQPVRGRRFGPVTLDPPLQWIMEAETWGDRNACEATLALATTDTADCSPQTRDGATFNTQEKGTEGSGSVALVRVVDVEKLDYNQKTRCAPNVGCHMSSPSAKCSAVSQNQAPDHS